MEGMMLEGLGTWISFVVLSMACMVGIWYVPAQIGGDGFGTFMKIIMSIIIIPICYIIMGIFENKG